MIACTPREPLVPRHRARPPAADGARGRRRPPGGRPRRGMRRADPRSAGVAPAPPPRAPRRRAVGRGPRLARAARGSTAARSPAAPRLADRDLLELSEESRIVVRAGRGAAVAAPGAAAPSGTLFRDAASMLVQRADLEATAARPQELRRYAERLHLINEVHRALTESPSRDVLLEMILDRVFATLRPEQAAVLLHRPRGRPRASRCRALPGSAPTRLLLAQPAARGDRAAAGGAGARCLRRRALRRRREHPRLRRAQRARRAAADARRASLGMIVLSSRAAGAAVQRGGPASCWCRSPRPRRCTCATSTSPRRRRSGGGWRRSSSWRGASSWRCCRRALPEVAGLRAARRQRALARRLRRPLHRRRAPRARRRHLPRLRRLRQGHGGLAARRLARGAGGRPHRGRPPARRDLPARLAPSVRAHAAGEVRHRLRRPARSRRASARLGQRRPQQRAAGARATARSSASPPRARRSGVLASAAYRRARPRSEPGDLLLVYTDGITEAADPDDEEFGIERLAESRSATARRRWPSCAARSSRRSTSSCAACRTPTTARCCSCAAGSREWGAAPVPSPRCSSACCSPGWSATRCWSPRSRRSAGSPTPRSPPSATCCAAPTSGRRCGARCGSRSPASWPAAALGVPLGFLFGRGDFPGRRTLAALLTLPVALPPLVGVIAFLFLWGESGFAARARAGRARPRRAAVAARRLAGDPARARLLVLRLLLPLHARGPGAARPQPARGGGGARRLALAHALRGDAARRCARRSPARRCSPS